MTGHMQQVRSWARRYYDMNLNPLPSCGHAKKPDLKGGQICRYRDRDRIPEDWLRRWWAPNIQIPLGVRWGLCVVDVDGVEGHDYWYSIISKNKDYYTWVSSSDGKFNGNKHIWFSIPEKVQTLWTNCLWRGGKGHEVKLMAGRSMVVVPPSVHPCNKTRYRWLIGPDELTWPTPAPDWLMGYSLRVLSDRAKARASSPRPLHRPLPSGPNGFGRHYQRDEVLYALGDRKHEIAARYGLEHRRHPNLAGFYDCRAVDRDDNDWSCTIDPRTGVYKDFATGKTLSFFDVLMILDPSEFPSYPETVDRLGSYCFGAPIRE